jgi:hypothetical protein
MQREMEDFRSQEFANVFDPLYAQQKFSEIMGLTVGARGYFPFYDLNKHPRPDMNWGIVNSAAPYQDTVRQYEYFRANPTGSKYLASEGLTDLWTVDAGVHNWNPNPGLTVGSWVRHKSYSVPLSSGIISCWNGDIDSRVWRLLNVNFPSVVSGVNRPRFDISSSGTALSKTIEIAVTPTIDEWVFYVGRWKPSTSIDVFLFEKSGLTKGTNTTTIPATLHRPTAANTDAYWGSYVNVGPTHNTADADLTMGFMVVTALTDAQIQRFYNISRHVFGV